MRAFYAVVFDDIVQNTTPVYTDPEHNGLLGSADKMSLQVVTNVFSGGPSLTVAVEHSPDDLTWGPRTTTPEINRVALSWTDTNSHVVAYQGAGSAACRVRFRVELSASATVRVKIVACGRSRTPRLLHHLSAAYPWPPARTPLISHGDDVLLDEETKTFVQLFEGLCGPNDRTLVYVRDELRRQVRERIEVATVAEAPLSRSPVQLDAASCGCCQTPSRER